MAGIAVVIIKRFTYRDVDEDWSNRYALTGAVPADSAAWRTLFDALVAEERKVYSAAVNVVGGYGYNDPDPTHSAVWSVDLTIAPNAPVAGNLAGTSGHLASGDQAVWQRWKLDKLNSKGKYVYLRKYFHGFYINDAARDAPSALTLTALGNLGTKFRDASLIDGRVIMDNDGTLTLATGSGPYVTTRTLKRRGKRPPP